MLDISSVTSRVVIYGKAQENCRGGLSHLHFRFKVERLLLKTYIKVLIELSSLGMDPLKWLFATFRVVKGKPESTSMVPVN